MPEYWRIACRRTANESHLVQATHLRTTFSAPDSSLSPTPFTNAPARQIRSQSQKSRAGQQMGDPQGCRRTSAPIIRPGPGRPEPNPSRRACKADVLAINSQTPDDKYAWHIWGISIVLSGHEIIFFLFDHALYTADRWQKYNYIFSSSTCVGLIQ